MKKVIDLLEQTKLKYTNLSPFGENVVLVHTDECHVARIEQHGDTFKILDYDSRYEYTEQTLDDVALHIDELREPELNGVVDTSTIPFGSFLE